MVVSVPNRVRPLRRTEYDQLVELGVFHDERLELLDGVLVEMSPTGPQHVSAIQKLTELLILALHGRASVRIQAPFAALELSEPEPDVVVAPRADYDTAHPAEADLIVEVSESSLKLDRGTKRRLYADCGVPEYWIVNLVERRIEVYTEPRQGAYQSTVVYERGDAIRLQRFPDVEVRVLDVIK